MTFTYEEIKQLIESEPEFPSGLSEEKEKQWQKEGVTYLAVARVSVRATKECLVKRLDKLKEEKK